MSLNESGDRLSVSDSSWSMEYNTDTPQLSEYEGRVVVYHLSNITEEEPINEEEEVVEEPINEEEEEVVEEPTNEEEEEVVKNLLIVVKIMIHQLG